MRLDDMDKGEAAILVAMIALLKALPEDDLKEYTPAIGEISTYFQGSGGKRGDHNPSPGSLARTRDVRASRRWT